MGRVAAEEGVVEEGDGDHVADLRHDDEHVEDAHVHAHLVLGHIVGEHDVGGGHDAGPSDAHERHGDHVELRLGDVVHGDEADAADGQG